MRIIAGAVLGLTALLGIGAGAVATGIVQMPFSFTQTNVQGTPPLQPLPAQLPNNADLIITLSERYLNRQLTQGLPQGGPVQNASLDVHGNDLADVFATVQINTQLSVKPKLSLRFSAQNGRIVIDVLQVDVGGFGVPSSWIEPQIQQLKQTMESELNRQFAEMEKTNGLKLQSLSTTENSLTLNFSQ